MVNLNKTIKSIYTKEYFPFLVLLIPVTIFHLNIISLIGDDVLFKNALKEPNFIEILINRYNTWSSRLIIEFTTIMILQFDYHLWKIIDIGLIISLAISTSKLFIERDKQKFNWIIIFLILMYPFKIMSEGGWGATTTNYLWPLCLGVFATIPIKKVYHNEELHGYEYFLYSTALLYAANQEQMALILCFIYILFSAYFFYMNNSSRYIILQACICLTSLVFILTAPGNYARLFKETTKWFPDYNLLNFMDKFILGFTTTILSYILNFDAIFITFCLFISISVWKKYNKALYRLMSLTPLFFSVFFNLYQKIICRTIPSLTSMYVQYPGKVFLKNIDIINFNHLSSYFSLIIGAITVGAIFFSIFLIFRNSKTGWLCLMVFSIGFSSRVVMGFSPTIFASGLRTYTFLYFSLIICCLLLIKELT